MHKTGELFLVLSWEISEVNVEEDKTESQLTLLLGEHSRRFVRREQSL